MKKLITYLMILIIIFSQNIVLAGNFTLDIDRTTAEPGQEAVINLDFVNNSGLIAAIFDVEYDRERLELIGAQDKALLSGAVFSQSYDKYPYRMLWNSSSSENFIEDGTIVTLTFRVKENAPMGNAFINISYNPEDVFDKDLNNVHIAVKSGNITVEEKQPVYISNSGGSYMKPQLPQSDQNDNTKTEIKSEQSKLMTFDDVRSEDWYYTAVKYVSENKLMNGITESTFAPDSSLTRAMLVTVLYRNEGEPPVTNKNKFKDIDKNSYYSDAVIWGYENKIVNGISEEKFAPERNITRQEIATIFYRYAVYKNYNIKFNTSYDLNTYTDAAEIAEYAAEAIIYAVNNNLLTGKSKYTFNPRDISTRAEIATVLMRFNKMYK